MLAGTVRAPAADAPGGSDDSNQQLYDAAKQLFDQYAPPEIKQQYDFPSKQQFDAFLAKLQQALDTGSLDDLAAYEPQARQFLAALRLVPDYAPSADWLAARLDELEAANAIVSPSGVRSPLPPPPSEPLDARIPYYSRWVQRVRGRPIPAGAERLMPVLQSAFSAEGVPPQLVWLAEAESSFDPDAESPAGARGLFQLKADTARSLGLSTFLPDERTDPQKSAEAAAKDLRRLGERFGSWPLAFAAYNAGEGRVSRLLAARHATTFAAIADELPGETRMYVPKVCALIAVRTGTPVTRLPAPS